MAGFLGQEESLDVFRCSNCQHFNSSKAVKCGKCSMPFSDEQKQTAIERTKLETKRHNVGYYKKIIIAGAAMFLGCGGLTLLLLLPLYFGEDGRISFWLVGLTFVGAGEILWGLRGLRAESKN